MHSGFFHFLFNVIAFTPLMQRFESEHGTLVSTLSFLGRKCGGLCLQIQSSADAVWIFSSLNFAGWHVPFD